MLFIIENTNQYIYIYISNIKAINKNYLPPQK